MGIGRKYFANVGRGKVENSDKSWLSFLFLNFAAA